jgi:hypothetical protein
VNFEDKNPTLNSHTSMNSMNSNSDWLKDVSNNLEWMNQKAHLVNTANEFKKRRLRCKKRCKKRRFKNLKTRKTEHSAAKKLVSALTRKWLVRLFSFSKAEEMCHVMTWHHLMMIRRYATELDPIENRLIHR